MDSTLRASAVLVLVAAAAAAQNLALNGDFERNEITGCNFNLSNASFDTALPGCTGFGLRAVGDGEIDVMEGSDCGYGLPAPSGGTKLGIAANGDGTGFDAFSITLKQPLVPGAAYRLTFQANAYVSDFSPEVGAVEVGLSGAANDFGTLVASLSPDPLIWTRFNGVIVAGSAATFLTVRQSQSADCWSHVDDFALEPLGAAGLTLVREDATVRVEGAMPDALVAVLASPAAGVGAVPAGSSCAGTTLSIGYPVSLAAVVLVDASGRAGFPSGMTLMPGTPLHLQAVDLSTCEVSPVASTE